MSETWDEVLKSLKYPDEYTMWKDLYLDRGWSIKKIADVLGFGTSTIRNRILENGIQLRGRGGRRNVGSSAQFKLLRIDPRQAFYGGIVEAGRLANLNISTVFHYRKWLTSTKGGMYEGLSDNSNKSVGDVRESMPDTSGVGSD